VSPLILLGMHWWFGIDETVYLSQINAYLPAGGFSAPRARGATLLAAPITLLTPSVAAVRLWVAALSGLALYLAFRPWLALHRRYAVPLAALLFSSLWVVIYYGFEVMPNLWDAFALLAATGYALRFLAEGARRHVAAVALALAVAALFRPSDALYGGAALVVGCLFVRASWRRRLAAAAAVIVGAAAGAADWIIEARTSYGGVRARIAAAQAENGGGGLHFSGGAQARTLAGPLLCRTGCHADAPLVDRLWWVAFAGLLMIGVIVGFRSGRRSAFLLPTFVAAALAGEYIFTVSYSAPRFLTPAYALAAVPCGAALLALVRWARRQTVRWVVGGIVALALAAHAAVQVDVILARVKPGGVAGNAAVLADAEQLSDDGLRTPCLILGDPGWNENLAYATRCGNRPGQPATLRTRIMRGVGVVWLRDRRPSPSVWPSWRRVLLPGDGQAVPAYIAVPAARAAAASTPTRSTGVDPAVEIGTQVRTRTRRSSLGSRTANRS
jgi:hypothetical protein